MTTLAPHPNSCAVVTGASSGIGAALARGLAARRHGLVLIARRIDRLQALAEELVARHGVAVELRPCDLADHTARTTLARELAARDVSVLCNNAGFATFGSLRDLAPEREAEQVELNVTAVHALTMAVLPGMLARRRGAILIVGSTAGHQPMPGSATYAATKAFANTFAESLHAELGGTGVACTLLAPGPVHTGFADVAGIAKIERVGGDFVWLLPERVAADTLTALDRGRRVVVPGMFAKLQTLGGRYTPRAVLVPALRTVLRKIV